MPLPTSNCFRSAEKKDFLVKFTPTSAMNFA